MEPNAIQQEIIFVTNTSFAYRWWFEKKLFQADPLKSHTEQLEEACWDGLLVELIPDIMQKSPNGDKLGLWYIRRGETTLNIELGVFSLPSRRIFSIDTDYFVETLSKN